MWALSRIRQLRSKLACWGKKSPAESPENPPPTTTQSYTSPVSCTFCGTLSYVPSRTAWAFWITCSVLPAEPFLLRSEHGAETGKHSWPAFRRRPSTCHRENRAGRCSHSARASCRDEDIYSQLRPFTSCARPRILAAASGRPSELAVAEAGFDCLLLLSFQQNCQGEK